MFTQMRATRPASRTGQTRAFICATPCTKHNLSNALDAGNTTPLYVAGRFPGVDLLSSVPFGPVAMTYLGWICNGGTWRMPPISVTVQAKRKTRQPAIESAFLKSDTHKHVLSIEEDVGNHRKTKRPVKIRFEVDT